MRHDYAFTPLSTFSTWFLTALSYSFSTSGLSRFLLLPLAISFARFHFVPPPRPRLVELSTSFLDFSVLPAIPETFPITRLLIAIRFPRNFRKFVKRRTYLGIRYGNSSTFPLTFGLRRKYSQRYSPMYRSKLNLYAKFVLS